MEKKPSEEPENPFSEPLTKSVSAEELIAYLAAHNLTPAPAAPAAPDELPKRYYNDLDTFLKQSSFAWHAELASRNWLEQGARYKGQLNTPRTTSWMAVLGYLNPQLNPHEQHGISPSDAPEVRILRAYQLLLTDLSPEQVAQQMEDNPLPDNLTDFLVQG